MAELLGLRPSTAWAGRRMNGFNIQSCPILEVASLQPQILKHVLKTVLNQHIWSCSSTYVPMEIGLQLNSRKALAHWHFAHKTCLSYQDKK